MNNLLIIDTSIPILSVSLYNVELNTFKEVIINEPFQHTKNITIAIEQLINKSKLTIKDVKAVSINGGPGSFTGLRVGSSIAKGLCFGLTIPLISLEGLKDYALFFYKNIEKMQNDVIVMIDARNDYYFCSYTIQGEAQPIEKLSKKEIENRMIQFNINSIFREDDMISSNLAEATLNKWNQKSFESLDTYEPNYLINNYQKK